MLLQLPELLAIRNDGMNYLFVKRHTCLLSVIPAKAGMTDFFGI